MKNRFFMLRTVLIILAIAFIMIPITIVGITGNGLGELSANLLISASILSLIGAILIGLDKSKKNKFYSTLGVSIGLLIILLSLWL